MSEETKAWLLSTALNFKDKQVPTDWGIVLVGHAPIFGDTNYATGENIDTECFDVITIDKEGRKITCNRYGAGFSRDIPIDKTT